MPRGSHPTMSKWSRRSSLRYSVRGFRDGRAGHARTSRVDEERADAPVGEVGRPAHEGQLDGAGRSGRRSRAAPRGWRTRGCHRSPASRGKRRAGWSSSPPRSAAPDVLRRRCRRRRRCTGRRRRSWELRPRCRRTSTVPADEEQAASTSGEGQARARHRKETGRAHHGMVRGTPIRSTAPVAFRRRCAEDPTWCSAPIRRPSRAPPSTRAWPGAPGPSPDRTGGRSSASWSSSGSTPSSAWRRRCCSAPCSTPPSPRATRPLVVVLATVTVLVALADAALGVAQRWFGRRVGEGMIFQLRTAVFDKVQQMPIAFFTRTQTGALVSRLNNDVIGAQSAVTGTLGSVVSQRHHARRHAHGDAAAGVASDAAHAGGPAAVHHPRQAGRPGHAADHPPSRWTSTPR